MVLKHNDKSDISMIYVDILYSVMCSAVRWWGTRARMLMYKVMLAPALAVVNVKTMFVDVSA